MKFLQGKANLVLSAVWGGSAVVSLMNGTYWEFLMLALLSAINIEIYLCKQKLHQVQAENSTLKNFMKENGVYFDEIRTTDDQVSPT